jgi:hypothetical protein
MDMIRKKIWPILFTLLAVALIAAVMHLASHAAGTPDQVGGGTATYNPWSQTPVAVVSTPAATAPAPAAPEPEDGGSDSGGDG